MTIQEAIKNIDIAVAKAEMNRNDHVALQDSISLVTQRCKLADELEKEKKEKQDG